jgi:predicted dehydrogenase
MMRQAREMIANGDLGDLRMVHVEYVQDWLTEAADPNNKQADWRTDPARSGAGGCVGDIGTHAFNLASYVTGLETQKLAADLTAFVPDRRVDDNVEVMLRFKGGAKGMLWASQIAVGNENALRLRVFGTKGGIEWDQETPNQMTFIRFGEPKQIYTRGGAAGAGAGLRNLRTPGGHPEGYLEAFATIYAEAAQIIQARKEGKNVPDGVHTPDISDGILGMKFIAACIESSNNDTAWVTL